jgi:hypothetical protein
MMSNSRVMVSKYKEHCFVLVSAKLRDTSETCGLICVKSVVSLLYDAGNVAAEWELEYGPIQIWRKADKLEEGTKEHYFYKFVYDTPMNWSQLAVDRNELPQAANRGDWDYIFSVLEDWAVDR